jgi:hypothetical protein
MSEEGDKGQSTSEIAKEDEDPVDRNLPEADSTLHPSHRNDHKVGSTQVLTGQDKHDESYGEEESGDESDETGVVGTEGSTTALDDLHEHGTEAELEVSLTKLLI